MISTQSRTLFYQTRPEVMLANQSRDYQPFPLRQCYECVSLHACVCQCCAIGVHPSAVHKRSLIPSKNRESERSTAYARVCTRQHREKRERACSVLERSASVTQRECPDQIFCAACACFVRGATVAILLSVVRLPKSSDVILLGLAIGPFFFRRFLLFPSVQTPLTHR